MQIKTLFQTLFFTSIIGAMIACGGGSGKSDGANVVSKRAGVNEVIVHMQSNPDRLNLVTATSSVASEVQNFIFEALITRDPETFEFIPILAKELGKVEEVTVDVFGVQKAGLKYSYEIREEAKWPDGSPITGHDAAFYVKCIKNPKVDCENLRPYLEAIFDVEVDATNPKKLAVIFQDKYFLSESLSGLAVLQESKYDAKGLMKNISIKDLNNPSLAAKLREDKNINAFATMFNSEEYSREIVLGSGPYVLKSWETGARIILERNPNWWGKDLAGKLKGFNNGPDKVIFEIIEDNTTAKTAQKDEGIDVMKHSSKDYMSLKDDKQFLEKFKLELPVEMSYSYIGINTKKPYLADKKVRQALSMALDYETLKKVFLYNLAERTVSNVHPLKNYYNKNIDLYPFDLEKAGKLLDEAGWKDTDGNGTRDKLINGQKVEMNLEFKHPSGSEFAENMALVYKKNLSQIGINLSVTAKEWTVFLEDTKSHNFDLVTMAWMAGGDLDDMKQIWHTDSYNGGSNYVGFGNAYTDELIEKIRYELDEEKRNKMYMEIQEIIHDEAPYIFLFTGKSKIAMHKRFDNAKGYSLRPNYFVNEFKLNANWGAKAVAE